MFIFTNVFVRQLYQRALYMTPL